MKRIIVTLSVVLFLFLLGCVGLQNPADCSSLRDSERISCWHRAAISKAYEEMPGDASTMCENIWDNVGANHVNGNNVKDDIAVNAETERNLCYYDIAKIIARQSSPTPSGSSFDFANNLCNNIKQDNYQTSLGGAAVTQDMCIKEVNRTASIRPEFYYGANSDNICSVFFVFPMILVLALVLKK